MHCALAGIVYAEHQTCMSCCQHVALSNHFRSISARIMLGRYKHACKLELNINAAAFVSCFVEHVLPVIGFCTDQLPFRS